jgi:hypothetical protein
MLTTSQKNLCLRIARGDINEQDVKTKITDEMRKDIEATKKLIEIHRANGREDIVKAMCVDE